MAGPAGRKLALGLQGARPARSYPTTDPSFIRGELNALEPHLPCVMCWAPLVSGACPNCNPEMTLLSAIKDQEEVP
jgi:hypothetical protein